MSDRCDGRGKYYRRYKVVEGVIPDCSYGGSGLLLLLLKYNAGATIAQRKSSELSFVSINDAADIQHLGEFEWCRVKSDGKDR